MKRTADPLVQIILEKRFRKKISENQRRGKLTRKKPNLRNFNKKG